MRRLIASFVGLSIFFSMTPLSSTALAHPARTPSHILNALLRSRIKHVFVIYQENRSFDSYFGTFPGADNLASPSAQTHGFRQYDPIGRQWVTPFRITAADTADADHARPALITKADGGRMDLYVETEEFGLLARGYSRNDAERLGLLTMAHEDCDTIPYLWYYAHNFALYDRFFQGMWGPSTPGNIDLIAAQTGETQWARDAAEQVAPNSKGPGDPIVNDSQPPFGPYPGSPPDPLKAQYDQHYATVFLTMAQRRAVEAKRDNHGIRKDIAAIARPGRPAIPWGWYQEGYAAAEHPNAMNLVHSYIPHHNALQYFGYLRKNPYFWGGVHDLTALFPAIEQGRLGKRSVVFIKGGKKNPFGLKPANKDPRVQARFRGDDDHPGYSDSQISEAMVAKVVDTIAHSRYWKSSAIFIFWDDSEGFYDHVPPPQFERCFDGHACGDGPRVPAILISPYARNHAIVNELSDHASFVKFLGTLFHLPALASLPDEKIYMPLGPRDTNPELSNLVGAFDPERLAGTKAPLPASLAEIPTRVVDSIPSPWTCRTIGVTPVHIPGENHPPKGFAPLLNNH
ncbi:MAG: phosphoesterase [Candidatus Eremiobacteraeota bacterium]|nr:phosphoesterase [Candidatus Eremiobacteraeota bacterium]